MSHPFDKAKIAAAGPRALIVADSAYHPWSHEQREIFRATMDDEARYRIRRSLLASLRGIECGSEEVARMKLAAMEISIDRLTTEQQNYLSSWEECT